MRSEATGTLSVVAVRVIAMGAAARGLPPPELRVRFGLDPALLADVDARVPVADVVALWNEVPRLVGDDDFGLLPPIRATHLTVGLDDSYTWDAGTYRHRGIVVTYLIGVPRPSLAPAQRQPPP